MAQKYTILKVIIQNFSRTNKTSKGFTLIELIVGLSIMLIVGGLAMNALVQSSISFNKDKKSIDSNQNISAVLEIIGNDIKQSGENINESKFPVIRIEPNTDSSNMPNSSKITIRRALISPLTLCEAITSTSTNTTLIVADESQAEPNCKLGTLSTVGTIVRPSGLKEARNKRCQLDNINGDYTAPTTNDFCLTTKATPDLEKVSAALSDNNGHVRKFEYVDDRLVSGSTNKYEIVMSSGGLSADTNTYGIGKPIYLIEERVYKLNSDGSFKLQIDGGIEQTLIKGIQKFNVSARVYGNKDTKEPDTISPAATPVAPNLLPLTRRCDSTIPYYICQFNTTSVDDWKTLQGVKVQLQAKYDSTGRAAESSTNSGDIAQVANDKDKLTVEAEFFPRNVLSK
jgi:prepilin-type N-terminal cleavage/methylation domain-containing protein